MKETPKMDFGLSFRMKSFCRNWHLPSLWLEVAGRHRAYPSVSLDNVPYVVVLLLELNLTMFCHMCQTLFQNNLVLFE